MQQRIAYLDNLRAFIVILVVLLHTLLPYAQVEPNLHYQWSDVTYLWAAKLIYCIHALAMPLFFLLSGFFAHYLISKKNLAYFINERLVRLGIPLVIGMILFIPIHFVVFSQYIWNTFSYATNVNNFWQTVEVAAGHGNFYHSFFNLEYLWFIYYLLIYSTIAVLLQLLKLPTLKLRYPVLTLSCFLALSMCLGNTPYIATPQYLTPIPQVFLSYGLFFYFGWFIYNNQTFLSQARIPCWYYLGIGFAFLFISLYFTLANYSHLIISFVLAITLVNLCFGTLLLFYCHLNQPVRICRYLSEISYWVYLTRIPILLCCQFFILRSTLNIGFQLFIGFFSAFFLAIISYQVLVKSSFLKNYLKGQHQLSFMRKWIGVPTCNESTI